MRFLTVLGSGVVALCLLLFVFHAVFFLYPMNSEQRLVHSFVYGDYSWQGVMSEDEYSHMLDVKKIFRSVLGVFLLSLLTSALLVYKDRQYLVRGSSYLLVFMGLLFVIILTNFSGGFAFFHELFFPQGNWMFSYDSYLITTYPLSFFISFSVALSVVSIVLGSIFILARNRLLHESGN